MIRQCLILILMLGVNMVNAQVKLTVNSTVALIGDKLSLQVEFDLPTGAEWVNTDVLPGDTVSGFQILGDGVISKSGNTVKRSWDFAVYDTGYVRIPPVMIALRSGARYDTMYSNDVPLRIEGVTDSTGMVPIKTIIYEPVKFEDYLPYILGAIGVLVASALLYWWSRRPKQKEVKEEPMVIRPAHELAMDELDHLASRNLWQGGHVKEFHSELNIILRRYLEKRYGVATLESTTREVSVILKPILSDDQYRDMMQMLELEDLIKFAKAEPPEDIHDQYFQFVRQFVKNTAAEPKNTDDNA